MRTRKFIKFLAAIISASYLLCYITIEVQLLHTKRLSGEENNIAADLGTAVAPKIESATKISTQSNREGTNNTISMTTDEIKTVVPSALSPLCNPTLPPEYTPIKRIVFGHMRKAGGTTILSFLNKVKDKYKLELVSYEGGCIERPGTRNDTLYITHIRNPVERAITDFKYSGRWNCQWMVYKHKRRPSTWLPTEENARSMEGWLKKGDGYMTLGGDKTLWNCRSNCFIKWLNRQHNEHDICVDKHGSHHSVNSSHYESALGTAQKFHLIIQTEKLRDKEYVQSLDNYFGLASTFTEEKIPMFCDNESKAANRAYPLNMTITARTLFSKLNTEDSHLFRDLSTCPSGIQFPKGSLGSLVHSKKSTR